MFRLLRTKSTEDRGLRQPPTIYDTYERVRGNVDRVSEWLRSQAFTVRSDHPLLNALRLMGLDPTMDLLDYHNHVVGQVNAVGRALSASTGVFVGKERVGSFLYGKGYTESILVTDFNYNLIDADDQWMHWKPLRIRRHPISELSVPSFLSMDVFGEKGRVVLEIDLVALAIQYRQWYRTHAAADSDDIPSPRRYITDYPLINAIPDHINVAVFNRLLGLFHGTTLGGHRRLVPIVTHDYTDRVDRYLLERTSSMIDRPGHFEYLLSNVLLPYGDLWDLIDLPNVGFTRQTNWIINLVRMYVFEWLVRVDYEGFRVSNRHHKNLIRRAIYNAGNDGLFRDAMGMDAHTEIMSYLNSNIVDYL